MDILPTRTKIKNSGPFSGLREWCTLFRLQELESNTSQTENGRRCTPKDDEGSVHLEFSNQTLVEYLSQKLERFTSKSQVLDLDLHTSPVSSRQLNTKLYQKYLEGMRLDDSTYNVRNPPIQGMITNSITSLRLNSQDNSWVHGKEKVRQTYKRTEKNTARSRMETSGQGRSSNFYDVYLSQEGISSSTSSNISMKMSDTSVKHEPNTQATGLGLPGRYVIGRHFYTLLSNLKNKTSPEPSPFTQGAHETRSRNKVDTFDLKNSRWRTVDSKPINLKNKTSPKPSPFTQGAHETRSRNKIDTFDLKNSRWRTIDTKPINLKSLRSVDILRRLRRGHKENTQCTRRSAKSKHMKSKSKHSRLSLDSETVESQLSLVESTSEGPSCASRSSRSKPLRTSMKTNCRQRRHYSDKRSVRFESYLDLCQNVAPPENDTLEIKQQTHEAVEWPTKATTEQGPALSSLINCSNSSSSVKLTSSHVRDSSSEECQQASLYKRLQSDDDSSKNDCRPELRSRPSRHKLESKKSKPTFPHSTPGVVPNRRSYVRLRNHGESSTALLNICKKSH